MAGTRVPNDGEGRIRWEFTPEFGRCSEDSSLSAGGGHKGSGVHESLGKEL